ncbi:unnamed protein product [Diabrotica balteata]|uniref:Uncharacterized protein n=1 Tax=Diabrotica balteata TaxID=107213 RepID=A0A9N9SQF4_DIABA|nr:unnamed protein product [Diabrotica balteata]
MLQIQEANSRRQTEEINKINDNSQRQAERIGKRVDENSKRQDLGFKHMKQRLERHKYEVQMYLQQVKYEVE